MRVRVLGCHGGETPRHRPTCLLIDGTVAIDAGSLCRGLPVEEQLAVEHVLVGHAHLDHIKDLALLAEQVCVEERRTPVDIHCGPATAEALDQHFFNDVLWPDFRVLPTKTRPAVRLRPHKANRKFNVGGYEVLFVPVAHPVESMGMLVQRDDHALVFSSDTGPTDKLWKTANRTEAVRAVFVELSFPNSLQELADTAGHLTPYTLAKELRKLQRADVDVFLYHLKPTCAAEAWREVRALRDERVHLLSVGDLIEI